jgi:hypothetical protein
MDASGRIDTPSTVIVARDSNIYTFNQEIQNLAPGVFTIDVLPGDMMIMTVYQVVGETNTFNVKWSHYEMSYPVDSVSTSYFVTNSVTTDKIADGAVTNEMISDNTITSRYIDYAGVTFADFSLNSVSGSKLINNLLVGEDFIPGTITGSMFSAGSITTIYLND